MRAYSVDLRLRVLAALDSGDTVAEAAEAFSVSPAFARRLRQRRRETGRVAPAPYRRHSPPTWVRLADRLRAAVAEAPDLTLAEYRERFALPLSALSVALRKLGLALEKSRRTPPSRPGPT